MSKKSGKEQYLDAKYVIENPNKFDYRDVARAKEFCNGYEAGQHETIVIGDGWISTDDELPKKGQIVVCVKRDYEEWHGETFKTKILRVGYYREAMKQYFSHWLPLPEISKSQ